MYKITSRFHQQESFRLSSHSGIDFSMQNHTPLRSIREGIAEVIDYGSINAGKCVKIKFEDGSTAIYGHLSEFTVKTGDKVKAGELIGYSGNSGHVVGTNGGYHLHFGLKNERGEFIDPSPYIENIQHMNDTNYFASMEHVQKTQEIIHHTTHTTDLFKLSSNIYSDFFSALKLNLISVLHSIDYTMFIHHFENLFQLFS